MPKARGSWPTTVTIGLALAGLAVLAGVALVLLIAIDARFLGGGSASRIVSHSMEPALLWGDRITARPVNPEEQIARGALVVFEYPRDSTTRYVKRVVGLPGDTIAMRAGILHINGREVHEADAWHADSVYPAAVDTDALEREYFSWQEAYRLPASDLTGPTRNNWGPLRIPPDNFFVLGDNRDNSLDSRYFGFVTRKAVVGIPRRVYYSSDSAGGLRMSRFGHLLR